MGEVVDIVSVQPKIEANTYRGHRYVLRFMPGEPDPMKRWEWTVKYTRSYEITGYTSNLGKARAAAEAKIRELIDRGERRA